MKLDEVLIKNSDPKELPFKTMARPYKAEIRDLKQDKNVEILGQGVEAVVYKTKDSPNVIKALGTHLKDVNEIPFVKYILMSLKYSNENPYFPKVYDIKKYETSSGTSFPIIYTFKMEPLVHLDKLSDKEMLVLWNKTFTEHRDIPPSTKSFSKRLETAYYASNYGKDVVKEENLSKVLKLISKARHITNSQTDIHDQNIMVRRTSQGPQLVITDPLVRYL